jgi:CPA1 family monovalent cation:H+ antiporter
MLRNQKPGAFRCPPSSYVLPQNQRSVMANETIFLVLFIVATTVAITARRLRIPYTVGLVLAGILLGIVQAFRAPPLTKDLLFSIFLPGLLFEAAFHLDCTAFWRNRMSILSLAVPGVVAATALTTVILSPIVETFHVVAGFNWHYALVFGALIAATDPIAVMAMFKSLGAPKRLTVLIEGESLLNDGTGIVFLTLSLSLVAGNRVAAGGLVLDFITIVGMGVIIGTAVGLAVSQVIRQVDDPMIEITLTTIAAYGAFVAAEHFGYSGVIATVSAGMFCGNYGARTGMSPSTRVAVETFWEYIAFALNSIVFLLIGFEVNLGALLASWPIILIAYLAVTAGRGMVILGVFGLLRLTRERLPASWRAVLIWGGLRGGLPMVLVLSLPPGFPYRELLVSMTFGVVVISILLQGLTMPPLLRWLNIVQGHEDRMLYEYTRGKIQASHAALAELAHMPQARLGDISTIAALRQEYEARMAQNEAQISALHFDAEHLHNEEIQWARRHLLQVEKDQVIGAFHHGTLNQEVYERLLADIDARLLRLESGDDRG